MPVKSHHVVPSGLYIHVPFCVSKCPYCDFHSTTDRSLVSEYITALESEMGMYEGEFGVFDTMYLGGGTPSVLTADQLPCIVEAARSHFHLAPETEITIELNPDDVTREKARSLVGCGFNRASLGVQSLNEAELRLLGRRHTAAQSRPALECLRAAGFSNISLDLMYSLPGQSEESWRGTLEQAMEYRPEHISCYQLIIKEGTPFARLRQAGELATADEEKERAFFILTARVLSEHGYLHYEVSNFAREERYCARHNGKYWTHAPYLGLGPAAHSFRNASRWWNQADVAEYAALCRRGEKPVAGSESLSPEQMRLERLMLGLRTREGVDCPDLVPGQALPTAIARLIEDGFVTVTGNRVAPTEKGFLIADRLPLLLL